MASQSPSSFGGHAPLSRPIGFTQQALCKVAYAGSGRQLSALPGRYAPYAPPPVALWVWLNGGFGQALCAVLFSQRLRRVIGCWPPPTLGARLLRKHRLRGLPVRPPRGLPQNRAAKQTIPWQPNGHTLNAQLEQATILMQDNQTKPSDVFVDLGYRGVDGDNPTVAIKHRGKFKSLSASDKRMLKRRQAIEPIIGHLKQDHRMDRCHLKGEMGDRLHAVLCAAGYNIKWLLRMIAKKGVAFKFLFLCLLGHEYWNDVQRLRNAVVTVRRWLVMPSVSQTSALPLRLAANSAF